MRGVNLQKIIIPKELSKLSTLSRGELVETLGKDPFREVVTEICLGRNVRNFTEILTRKRLIQSNMALWDFFCVNKKNGLSPLDMIEIAKQQIISGKASSKDKPIYQWLTALTGKQVQNVLRKHQEPTEFDVLTQNTLSILKDECKSSSGVEPTTVEYDDSLFFTPEELYWIFLVIGSQTLTIRGSEKSLHGKYFEKLVLGSVFQIFGFKLLAVDDISQNGFWLSSQKDNDRESDCTIIHDDLGIRVDIGFIGSGNSEITLDKVSRYLKEAEIAGKKYSMSTIIIVDTLGAKSKAKGLAEKIDGVIICMSDPDWILQLFRLVSLKLNIDNPLEYITEGPQLENYIRQKIVSIDLEELINA